ncbi:MAG: helix-turn-helix domain-containing protein [Bacteroidetes bacterium]|nr:helix-turn-helix domain-containing protein [Fibrella sp.]
MVYNSETTRLIFGLKLRQLRLDLGISSLEVSKRAGLSPSYMTELEKGKKYPKVEKMFDLARALETDYETLVSPRLSKKLEPLANLIHSRVLNELPLDWLGLDASDLLALLAEAPAKVSAFISTLIEISRSYGMRVESFLFSVLRTYQEMQDNYFPELEEAAEQFRATLDWPVNEPLHHDQLGQLLTARFAYQLENFTGDQYPALATVRSVFLPQQQNRLLINAALTHPQRAFTLARELGYRVLNLTERPLISSVREAESFGHVLNNFRASYVAGAMLMPRQPMVDDLRELFEAETYNPDRWLALIQRYAVTPEMFMHRLMGLLATQFGLNDSFFLRLNHRTGDEDYLLTKEMHLARLHSPHTTIGEHYCRRWVSIGVIHELDRQQHAGEWNGHPVIRAQISDYFESPDTYLVLAIAQTSSPETGVNSSVSLGIAVNDRLRQVVRFLNDPNLTHRLVNQTCERCGVADCLERVARPTIYQREKQTEEIRHLYGEL